MTLTPEQQAVYDRAYRESLNATNSGWNAMVDAQRELGAFLELQAEDAAAGPSDDEVVRAARRLQG